MHQHPQQYSQGIDEQMAFASRELLRPVVAVRAAALAGLARLDAR